MASGAFEGGVVEIHFFAGELEVIGTVQSVQQACQDGKLIPNEKLNNLIQLAMSSKSGKYHDETKVLKVKVNDRGEMGIAHKRADDTLRRMMTQQLFLAGWINLGFYVGVTHQLVDRWGYKTR